MMKNPANIGTLYPILGSVKKCQIRVTPEILSFDKFNKFYFNVLTYVSKDLQLDWKVTGQKLWMRKVLPLRQFHALIRYASPPPGVVVLKMFGLHLSFLQ